MNRLTMLSSALLLLATCSGLLGQEPARSRPASRGGLTLNNGPSEVSPSMNPELWLYQQELRRYEDPEQAVRRNAERRAAERRDRIAARQWMGIVPSRPLVFHTPFMAVYGPTWPTYFSNGYSMPPSAVWVDMQRAAVRVGQNPTEQY